MNTPSVLWEFLSRDVAFLGGPHSPMLSWLGSCGIVLFFVWQVLKLKKETTSVQQAFDGVRPMLTALAKERGEIDRDRFTHHPGTRSTTHTSRTPSSSTRIDCDDIQTLNSGMQREPMFAGPWAQYRMTLILEQVPWFVEPRIFSTRRAAEVFTQEALMANHVNLAFYRQFPSLVTGIGLLLTFLALFIGLGKLHAEGSEIVGIQGLINGLAGKFLTSIVGLIVANVFTFLEKPTLSRLIKAHHTFLGLIDQLFPRKTMEQMLEQLTAMQGGQSKDGSISGMEIREHTGGWGTNGLAAPTANLTAAIQSLTKLQQDEHAETRRTATKLPYIIKEELHGPLNELTNAIHALTRLLKDAPSNSVGMEPPFDDRSLLWKTSAYPRTSSHINFFERISSWPKRSWLSRPRRTG
ncbi:MAG: hypothetical protein OEW26_05400 [Nitrospirota bacterium]|nr:hypothetical protein [Nitrospirota bacterium]